MLLDKTEVPEEEQLDILLISNSTSLLTRVIADECSQCIGAHLFQVKLLAKAIGVAICDFSFLCLHLAMLDGQILWLNSFGIAELLGISVNLLLSRVVKYVPNKPFLVKVPKGLWINHWTTDASPAKSILKNNYWMLEEVKWSSFKFKMIPIKRIFWWQRETSPLYEEHSCQLWNCHLH